MQANVLRAVDKGRAAPQCSADLSLGESNGT